MVPGGEDVIIRHGLSVDSARKLTCAYFFKLWPNCVLVEDEDGTMFLHEDTSIKERIDKEGVRNEHGFAQVLSLDGELTVVVEPGDFAMQCKQKLTHILSANLGF